MSALFFLLGTWPSFLEGKIQSTTQATPLGWDTRKTFLRGHGWQVRTPSMLMLGHRWSHPGKDACRRGWRCSRNRGRFFPCPDSCDGGMSLPRSQPHSLPSSSSEDPRLRFSQESFSKNLPLVPRSVCNPKAGEEKKERVERVSFHSFSSWLGFFWTSH